jgi:hypothetical protein
MLALVIHFLVLESAADPLGAAPARLDELWM